MDAALSKAEKLIAFRDRSGLTFRECRLFLLQTDWDLEAAIALAKEATRLDRIRRGCIMVD